MVGSWASLGGGLEGVLGSLWERPGAVLGHLGTTWRHLGASWRYLDVFLLGSYFVTALKLIL